MIDTPLIDSSFLMHRGVNETSAHQLFSEVTTQTVTLINRRREFASFYGCDEVKQWQEKSTSR